MEPGQGHQRERSGFGVEFGRGVVVRHDALPERDRARQQRGGALIRRPCRGDEHDPMAKLIEEKRRREAYWPGTGNDDLRLAFAHSAAASAVCRVGMVLDVRSMTSPA